MVTHGNLMANAVRIAEACRHDANSRFVGWMPLFHDMGLMGNVLQPLYIGARGILMPRAAFTERVGPLVSGDLALSRSHERRPRLRVRALPAHDYGRRL
jgi:AMP-binding enzyme